MGSRENRSGWCLHASVRNVSEADRKGKLGRQKEIRRENKEGRPCNLFNRFLAGRSSFALMGLLKGTKWPKNKIVLRSLDQFNLLQNKLQFEAKMRFLLYLGLEPAGSRGEGLWINVAICEQNF